ncbi:hypothetical protein [Mesorhizobium sp. ORS 3428]|uniref:hypothetical protein n=1 Tax=Mesorhizobium sp. ORS 3428 TaxID=540997 RepID=UPI0010424C05|nr:hypothetical protein [Mesorhizobium sp. ORS 3428]
MIKGGQCLADETGIVAELAQAARLLQAGAPSFLVPTAHRGAFGIGYCGLLRPPGVTVGLRKIVPISVVFRIAFESSQKELDVTLELVDPVRARGVILVPNAPKLLHPARHVDIFVGNAVIARAGVAPDQTRVPVGKARIRPLQEPIARAVEPSAEIPILDDKLHVGIVEQQIVIGELRGIGTVERRVARLLEIVKGKLMQFAGHIASGKERSNEILASIGRSGIANDPAVDVVGNRTKTALEICHLVLDDHVEADALAVCHP